MKYIFQALCCILVMSCSNMSKNKEETTATVTPTPSATIEVADDQYPSISQDEITSLYMQCDYVDFVFYELPFSMSFDNKPAITNALSWISPSVPVITKNCPSLGRMVFQSKGEIIMEAEMVVTEANECGHMIWIKDGKKLFANRFNTNGKKYLLGIIAQNLNR